MLTSLLLASLCLDAHADLLDTPLEPIYQQIDLTLDPSRATYEGEVLITVDVPARTRLRSFELHAEGLRAREASVRRVNGWRERPYPTATEVVGEQRLRLTPSRPMRHGRYVIRIAYEGELQDQPFGLYRFEHGGDWYAVTQLEADEARTAWPSFDEPAYKMPWQITVHVPEGLETISNAPIASEKVDDGVRTVAFAWTPPVPSYAVALAVGPYQGTPVPGMGVPSTVWTTRGRESLAPSLVDALPGVTDWLQDWFSSPYPFAKLDFVAVPSFAFGAMENPGCVVVHEGLLYDAASATAGARRNVLRVTAHEVAHMWFGDLVTMAWWDDLWLNEAFATWMGMNTMHALAPEFRDDVARVGRLSRMIRSDGTATSRPLRTEVDPAAVFETSNFAVYPKGEALLDMTRAWIGPEVFRSGLASYLEQHAWGNATHQDLFRALQTASGKPVGDMMSGYLDRPGAPRVQLTREADGRFTVRQDRYALLGETVEPDTWFVPLRLRIGRADGPPEVVAVELREAEHTIDLGPGVTWVHPATDGIGYYAWSVDEGTEAALLEALDALAPSERRSLVEAVDLQVAAGTRELADLLGLVSAFADEADAAVVDAVREAASRIEVVRRLEDPDLERTMERWVRAALRPHLDRMGMEPGDDDTPVVARLRRELLDALGDVGEPDVRAYGLRIGGAFLEDPRSVPYDLGMWGITVLAEEGDVALQRVLLERATTTDDLRLAGTWSFAAALVPGDDARQRARTTALDPSTMANVRNHLFEGMRAALRTPAERDEQLDWLMANHEAIAASLPPVWRPRLAQAGAGCSVERFERSRAFYADPARAVPGTERVLRETERRVRRCLDNRAQHGASARAFLEAWRR